MVASLDGRDFDDPIPKSVQKKGFRKNWTGFEWLIVNFMLIVAGHQYWGKQQYYQLMTVGGQLLKFESK